MLYVPLDLNNGLTVDTLVDSAANVSATAQNDFKSIKQQATANLFKIDGSPNF